MSFMRAHGDGVELSVLVQPRASRTRVVGVHGDRLKIQVAAPPVDDAANEALVEFLAGLFAVSRRQLTLVSGHAARQKRLLISGVSPERVALAIEVPS